ncbi:MAG TPA: site-specific integrase [Terriglobales bacterium]|nr:site-specific integrase [Terriglobales bacterium]
MPKRKVRDRDGVYARKDRPGYWITWNDAQGKRKRRMTHARTLKQARDARAAELVRVERQRAIGFAPPVPETFADVCSRFLAHQKSRLTAKAYEREAGIVNGHLKASFSGLVASIRRVDVQRYVTQRASEVSAHSIQKELHVLKHLLRLAVEWEIIPFSPALAVKSPRVPAGRVRYLQPTELRALVTEAPEWLRPIITIAVSTGMRRSEMLGLRWLDVDLLSGRVLLPQTKNGDARVVYLNQSALSAFYSIYPAREWLPTDRVFQHVSPEQVSVAFARLCRSLKILDFRFHDLRHTAASWLRMQGADIHTVAQLLGHKDLRMAARYQHLSPTSLADAVSRLDAVFGLPRHLGVTAVPQLPIDNAAND